MHGITSCCVVEARCLDKHSSSVSVLDDEGHIGAKHPVPHDEKELGIVVPAATLTYTRSSGPSAMVWSLP